MKNVLKKAQERKTHVEGLLAVSKAKLMDDIDSGRVDDAARMMNEVIGHLTEIQMVNCFLVLDSTKQLDWVIRMAFACPDDTWSGRTNEARRVANDSKRKILIWFHEMLREK